MKKQNIKKYVFWIFLTLAVGVVAGLLTREATEAYKEEIIKPPFSPPAILFPVVWTVLYVLMGVSAARISIAAKTKRTKNSVYIYIAQLFFNFMWSIIFFNFQAFGFAFIWLAVLWALIFLMIREFGKTDSLAAKLQIPYIVWVSFAGYLNLGVWLLNR